MLLISAYGSVSPGTAADITQDITRLFLNADAVKVLGDTLQSIDLNHPQAVDISNSIVRSMDILTKAALVHGDWQESQEKDLVKAGAVDIQTLNFLLNNLILCERSPLIYNQIWKYLWRFLTCVWL